MFTAGGLRGTGTDDLCHSQWNAARMAIRKSGLQMVLLEVSMVLNMFTASYGGDTFWSQICSTMSEYLVDNTIEDPLFEFFLPILCSQEERASYDFGATSQGVRIWDSIVSWKFLKAKPARMKLTRWFHFIRLSAGLTSYWFQLLFALVVLALEQGWDVSIANFSVLGRASARDRSATAPSAGAPSGATALSIVASAAGSASAPATSPPSDAKGAKTSAAAAAKGVAADLAAAREDAPGGDIGRGTKHGDAGVEKLRATTVNAIDACLQVLKSAKSWSWNQLIVLFGGMASEVHGRDVVALSTQQGAAFWHRDQAMRGNTTLLRKMARQLHSPDLLPKLRPPFTVDSMCGAESDAPFDDELCAGAFSYVCNLMSVFGLMGLQYMRCLPQKLHLLASQPKSDEVQSGLRFCEEVFSSLEGLEKAMAHDVGLRAFHGQLFWAHEQWVREVLVAVAECEFKVVPAWVMESTQAYTRRWGTTKLSEDSINANRGQERSGRKGGVDRTKRWATAMANTHIEEQYDVKLARPDKQRCEGLRRRTPASIYHARGGD